MALTIPKPAHRAARALFNLPVAEKREFLEALKEATPVADLYSFAKQLETSLSPEQTTDFLRLIFGFYHLIDSDEDAKLLSNELAESIGALFQEKGEVNDSDETQKEEFKRFLEDLLSVDALAKSAKGLKLISQYERLFRFAEIYTDFRGVFSNENPDSPPETGVVTHTLKIHYHASDERGYDDFYLTLNRDDLESLSDIIVRALDKQKGLEKLLEESNRSSLSVPGGKE